MERTGRESNGMDERLNGTEWNGTDRKGMEWNGMNERVNGTEWNGTDRKGMEWTYNSLFLAHAANEGVISGFF